MSEIEVNTTFWNALSQKAQFGLSKNHQIIVKSDYFTEKGTPKCAICGHSMIEAEDSITKTKTGHIWKLNCECAKKNSKLQDLRLMLG